MSDNSSGGAGLVRIVLLEIASLPCLHNTANRSIAAHPAENFNFFKFPRADPSGALKKIVEKEIQNSGRILDKVNRAFSPEQASAVKVSPPTMEPHLNIQTSHLPGLIRHCGMLHQPKIIPESEYRVHGRSLEVTLFAPPEFPEDRGTVGPKFMLIRPNLGAAEPTSGCEVTQVPPQIPKIVNGIA
ncbi:unnamed protein product [Tuber aestivum]|uniref:Uncharacterized protein n=1 Tax=Tuber aestivum TaxID=59557 RepID=A0A292Q9R6_9PEZI|nr:unnamed protein product [Tuber aestivum]